MLRIRLILLFCVATLLLYLLLWPVSVEPVAWVPVQDPQLSGVFEKNHELASIERIPILGVGPEDIVIGPDKLLYAGVDDGRIVRFSPNNPSSIETFVNTGGRPLGLEFDGSANLIVADQHRGLLSVSPTRELTVLANASNCSSLNFANDLDIASDGIIWLSDSTQNEDKHAFTDFLDGRATGRLISFSPATGECSVRMDGLRFANGVALGPDDAYILVAETLGARILQLTLKGPRAGESEIFLGALPGYPDNLSFDHDLDNPRFWVAFPSVRVGYFEWFAQRPALRKILMRLPLNASSGNAVAWIASIDTKGIVQTNLQDWTGAFGAVTSVSRVDGMLYLGSIDATAIARIAVPPVNSQ